MDVSSIAPIIHRLNTSIDEELRNIRLVKNNSPKTGDFEVASIARDLEKKLIVMKRMLNPLYNQKANTEIDK